MYDIAAFLVVLFAQNFIGGQCHTAAEIFNDIYSSYGINFDSNDPFWYQFDEGFNLNCTECSCDNRRRTVTGCSGNATISRYVFDNITADSLSSGITSLTIAHIPSFQTWGPNTFDGLIDLTSIIVFETGLTQFPDISDTSNPKLKELILRNNNIKFDSKNTWTINWPSSLKSLCLENNDIDFIPSGFFNGSKLEFVRLMKNRIIEISDENFIGVTSLFYLDMVENQINTISFGALAVLPNLRLIEIRNNKLTEFRSDVFGNQSQVLHVDISFNNITSIEAGSIPNSTFLVNLEHNQFKFTNEGPFMNLSNLAHLMADNNMVSYIPEKAFYGCTRLRTITLSWNKISIVPEKAFIHCTDLQILSLSGNEFRFTQPSPFTNLESLMVLDLSNNTISFIPERAFHGSTDLVFLDLNANQIVCDCHAHASLEKVALAISGARCSSPAALNGSLLFYSTQNVLGIDRNKFLCPPINLQTSSPSPTEIMTKWENPPSPVLPAINVSDSEISKWSYQVSCKNMMTKKVHSAVVNSMNFTFTSADGITNNTEYTCDVSLITGENITSAPSKPSVVNTHILTGPDGQQQEIGPHHTLVLSKAVQNKWSCLLRFLLIEGESLNEPIVQQGPFVVNSREEIQADINDYRMGRNGFEKAMTWESQQVQGRRG